MDNPNVALCIGGLFDCDYLMKPGTIKKKRCKYCKKWFYPNRADNTNCPECSCNSNRWKKLSYNEE